MSTKKQRQAEQILRHGFQLQRIFPDANASGPVDLCKKLHRLEVFATRKAEDLCNGVLQEPDDKDYSDGVMKSLIKILNPPAHIKLYINRDPRGYALKIDDECKRKYNLEIYTDMGGYGILAPEFNGDR